MMTNPIGAGQLTIMDRLQIVFRIPQLFLSDDDCKNIAIETLCSKKISNTMKVQEREMKIRSYPTQGA